MTLRVILVHGTQLLPFRLLGKVPRWVEEKSLFQIRLSQELANRGRRHQFAAPFLWTGKNDANSRNIAGAELAQRIESEYVNHPTDNLLVIGHSHGGNVALLALVWLKKFGLLPVSHSTCITTIATPFLSVHELQGNELRFASYRRADNLLLYSQLTILIVAFISEWMAQIPVPLLFWIVVGFSCILQFIAPVVNWGTQYRPRRFFELLPIRYDYELTSHWVQAADTAPFSRAPARLLVLRGGDDEAAFALIIASLIGRLLHVVTVLLGSRISLVLLNLTITVTVFASHYISQPSIDLSFYMLNLVYCNVAVIGVSFWLAAFLIAANYANVLYGLPGSGLIDVTTHSTPDAVSDIVVHSVPSSGQSHLRLAHKLYENPACATLIADWV